MRAGARLLQGASAADQAVQAHIEGLARALADLRGPHVGRRIVRPRIISTVHVDPYKLIVGGICKQRYVFNLPKHIWLCTG